MPRTKIEALPVELIERIVLLLPIRDIGSLRLSNRELAAKATQEHFKSFFRTKSVDFTLSSLKSFAAFTKPSRLACLLEHLTIVGIVNNTIELEGRTRDRSKNVSIFNEHGDFEEIGTVDLAETELEQTRTDLATLQSRRAEHERAQDDGVLYELLSQSLSNTAAAKGDKPTLKSLSMEVMVYRDDAVTRLLPVYGGAWTFIWRVAANTFHAVMAALSATGISLEQLDIFDNDRMKRCSLACDELGKVDWEAEKLASSLAGLKGLSLSISDKIIFETEKREISIDDFCKPYVYDADTVDRPEDEVAAEAEDETNFVGLADLLRHSSHLQDLRVTHVCLGYDPRIGDTQDHGILEQLATNQLPVLKKFAFRGFTSIDEQPLLALLRQNPAIRELSLCSNTLIDAEWMPLLDYCTVEAGMTQLHLNTLFGDGRIIRFQDPWARGTRRVVAEYRRPEGNPEPRIRYEVPRRTEDTIASREATRGLKHKYGPPGYGARSCTIGILRAEQAGRYTRH